MWFGLQNDRGTQRDSYSSSSFWSPEKTSLNWSYTGNIAIQAIEAPASGLSLGALPSTPPPPLFSSISVTRIIWLSIDTRKCLRMWTDPVKSACGLSLSSLDGSTSSVMVDASVSVPPGEANGGRWVHWEAQPRRLQFHPLLQPSISKGRKQLPSTPREAGEGGLVSWLARFPVCAFTI